MDAVILAAGKNERLAGIVPPFMKPLMVVNGETLLARSVRQAYEACASNVIVVVSPSNAEQINSVLRHEAQMTIQRFPKGPLDALYQGARLSDSDDLLVLMGDNFHEATAVSDVTSTPNRSAVGVRRMPLNKVGGLSWYSEDDHKWYEKQPVDPYAEDPVFAWCGPVTMPTDVVFEMHPIAENISEIFNTRTFTQVIVESFDIGTPEALR